MIKTIKIGEKEVRLDNNVSWAMTYRDQVGQDIMPTLMPILAMILGVASNVLGDGKREISTEEVIEALSDPEVLSKFYAVEFVDFLNITWALAKTADDSIPEPKRWLRELGEGFYMDEVFPEVFGLIVKGVVSSKNLERLKGLKTKLQPLNLTISSSPDSNED